MVISLCVDRARVQSAANPGVTTDGKTPGAERGAVPGTTPGTTPASTPGAAPISAPDGAGFLTIGGLRVRYRTMGHGAPLLLLHGWGTSLDTFRPMAEDLGRFHAVTCFDFPGHGQSDLPPGAWAVDDFVALTLELMAVGVPMAMAQEREATPAP